MNRIKEREIIEDLLIDFHLEKIDNVDLQRVGGDPAVARADHLIRILNKITPHAAAFPDDIKLKVKTFIENYNVAKESRNESKVFELTAPTYNIIRDYLKTRLNEL